MVSHCAAPVLLVLINGASVPYFFRFGVLGVVPGFRQK
jgi:hypothetical protein